MKTTHLLVLSMVTALAVGCSTTEQKNVEDASRGPVVMNPRSSPEKVELNRYLQAKQPQQFYAEVQDMTSPITEVRARLGGTNVEIPMEKVGGTTYRGELSSDQLKQLAISGQTVEYKAQITARNENGVIGMSKEVAELEIKAPQFEEDSG